MQLHLFAFWFVNYNLVKYKIMIIILKIMLKKKNLNPILIKKKSPPPPPPPPPYFQSRQMDYKLNVNVCIMDTASFQVEVFSICLFSPQTDDEQKQIKNTWPVKMWYSGSLCGLSISPSWLKSLMNFHFIFSYPDYSKPDLIASYI